jgi:uncharacterized protein involved in exopolysaccharide biosynthesis
MPILRRDEAPDRFGAHLVYLWDRKLWLILPTVFVFVLTYIAMRIVREEFKVTAAVYVNRLMTGQEPTEMASPSAVAQLLESNELLHHVRDEYTKAFNVAGAPEFEKFVRRFKVKTEVLQDTSVRKDISPVIELEVQSDGSSETRFLMDSWIRNFIQKYGNVAADEAASKRDDLLREDARIAKDLQQLETNRAEVRAKLALQGKLLAENLNLLAPAELPRDEINADRLMNTDVDSRTGGDSNIRLNIDATPKPLGLITRLRNVRIDMAKGTSASADLQREAAALEAAIQDTQTSIVQLQKTVSELQPEQARLDREVEFQRSIQARLHVSLNRFSVAAALVHPANDSNLAGADVRAVSMPVMPELRVWPKRTFVAAGAALAALIIMIVGLLVHGYLQSLALRKEAEAM